MEFLRSYQPICTSVDCDDTVVCCMHDQGIDIESQELLSQTYSQVRNFDDGIAQRIHIGRGLPRSPSAVANLEAP